MKGGDVKMEHLVMLLTLLIAPIRARGSHPAKNTLAVLLLAFCLPCFAGTYYSVFPFAETPITQNNILGNAIWTNGMGTGLDWSNCVSIPGFVHGTQTGAGCGSCNYDYTDSTAVLAGTWGATQRVDAVVKVYNQSASTVGQEVEVRLLTTVAAHSIKGYEVDYSVCAANPYVAIARWDGARGVYTILGSVDTTHYAHDGDTISGVASNGVIYLYINGSLIISRADSTYTSGQPGIGFFLDNNNGTSSPGNSTNFGFTSVMATDFAHSVTNNAATPAQPDVQTMIYCATNEATDVVTVPAGTIYWATNTYVTNNLLIYGAGTNTAIVDEINRGYPKQGLFCWTVDTNNIRARLTQFQFAGGVTNANTTNTFDGSIQIGGNDFGFRMDHLFFTNLHNKSVTVLGWVYGVYDHNTDFSNFKQALYLQHDGYGGASYGDASYAAPDMMGTSNAWYIENNTLIELSTATPGKFDVCGGGRMVIRYNLFTNCNATTHGTESTGRMRSVRVLEIYGNTYWTDPSGSFSTTLGQYRGGTGVIFSNTYIGPYANGMTLTCYRMIYPFVYWWGANGTNVWDQNSTTVFASGSHVGANLANILTANGSPGWTVNQWVGYTLRDVTTQMASIITANDAGTITFDQNGSSVGNGTNMVFNTGDLFEVRKILIALDQPGRGQGDLLSGLPPTPVTWPNQALSPINAWSNTLNGSLSSAAIGSGEYYQIQANRDYYNDTPKAGYTPWYYPHPLIQAPQVVQQSSGSVSLGASGKSSIGKGATILE